MINTTKYDLCLFLHKMCCKIVWNFCEIGTVLWELAFRWAKFCEILSHGVRYSMYYFYYYIIKSRRDSSKIWYCILSMHGNFIRGRPKLLIWIRGIIRRWFICFQEPCSRNLLAICICHMIAQMNQAVVPCRTFVGGCKSNAKMVSWLNFAEVWNVL